MLRSEISAVVVTKGDRDISEVLDSLKDFGEVIVRNNAEYPWMDYKVYGRWHAVHAAPCAKYGVIYTQDDDTIVDTEALCAQWRQGRILCNMPQRWRRAYESTGISLVGFGAVFERWRVRSGFADYIGKFPQDEVFYRECDRVWTFGNRGLIDWAEVSIKQLPYSSAPDRMYREARTNGDYIEIRRRLACL